MFTSIEIDDFYKLQSNKYYFIINISRFRAYVYEAIDHHFNSIQYTILIENVSNTIKHYIYIITNKIPITLLMAVSSRTTTEK
jgi:hypothetical protein